MIPLRLTLHNFMCYRDPAPLDFSDLHLACLTGDNGHGKSALLDAITWALWGKARSSQADDLIHLGQSDMWVDFEFVLGASRYRVLRSRERRGRSGKSELQLQVWAPQAGQGGEFRPLTEPTLRETEQRIVELLRMDYDTFVNSAFLVQGRADEFTIKAPNERKQVLANILGLNVYDQYEARAKELARQRKLDAASLEAQIAVIDGELAREAEYRAALQSAQAAMVDLSDRLRSAEQTRRELQATRQDLLSQKAALGEGRARLARGEHELADIQEQIAEASERLVADQGLIAGRAAIEDGHQALRAARQADQAWNEKLKQQVELQLQHSRLTQQIGQARSQLEADRRVIASELAQVQEAARREPELLARLSAAQSQLAALADQEQQQATLQAHVQALREEYAGLKSELQRSDTSQRELQERLALLEQAEATCPVCGQPLGPAERDKVISDARRQEEILLGQRQLLEAKLTAVTEQGQAGKETLQTIDQALTSRAHWQRLEAQAEAQLADARRIQAERAPLQAQLEQITARLASDDFAQEAQRALRAVESQLAVLAYDPAAHEQARQALVDDEPFEERYRQVQAALERSQELQARLERLEAGRARWQNALAADRQRCDELAITVARLPQLEETLRRQAGEVERLEELVNQARQRYGAAQQRLEACRAQASQRQALSAELQTLKDQQAIYEELQAAFGKKGLQAMIIEAAIPEIEAEANQLLGRMTDGRMAVRMETQRETKTTQEVRETLDIIISDELGSRDYSLYSGGEAFRANFAIRIALSKLLARRAGARLQTLIIDEGFGTQDAQGRERLVQAITSIQDDFERILVITHIDELKDHFPARIDILKTVDGSQISVN